MFIKIDLRKKWLMHGSYHPPNQPNNCVFQTVGTALDQYQQIYINFLLLGGFIVEDTETNLSKFLEQ